MKKKNDNLFLDTQLGRLSSNLLICNLSNGVFFFLVFFIVIFIFLNENTKNKDKGNENTENKAKFSQKLKDTLAIASASIILFSSSSTTAKLPNDSSPNYYSYFREEANSECLQESLNVPIEEAEQIISQRAAKTRSTVLGQKEHCLQSIENVKIDLLADARKRHNDNIKSIMDKNYSNKDHRKKINAATKELERKEKEINQKYNNEKKEINSRYKDFSQNIDELKFGWVKRERETAFKREKGFKDFIKSDNLINPPEAFSNLRDFQPEYLPQPGDENKWDGDENKFLPPADGNEWDGNQW